MEDNGTSRIRKNETIIKKCIIDDENSIEGDCYRKYDDGIDTTASGGNCPLSSSIKVISELPTSVKNSIMSGSSDDDDATSYISCDQQHNDDFDDTIQTQERSLAEDDSCDDATLSSLRQVMTAVDVSPITVVDDSTLNSTPERTRIENHTVVRQQVPIVADTTQSNDADEPCGPHNSSKIPSRQQTQPEDAIFKCSPRRTDAETLTSDPHENRRTTSTAAQSDRDNCNVVPLPYNMLHTYTHKLVKYNPIIFSPFQLTRKSSRYDRGSILLGDQENEDNVYTDFRTKLSAHTNDGNVRKGILVKLGKIFRTLLCCGSSSILIYSVVTSFVTLLLLAATTKTAQLPRIEVAMIGNSMMYYNDLPRFIGT
jgi:hypothetical protein